MSDEDEQFQQRWGFRRNDCGVDSSSDDQSRPNSVSEPTRKKHKIATRPLPGGSDQKTMHNPQPQPGGENHSSYGEPNKEPKKSCKKQGKKARIRRPDRMASDHEPSDGGLIDLRGHMESLVEGVKVARENLLKWMSAELEKSFKDDKPSQPAAAKKNQRRGSKEAQNIDSKKSAAPRNNANKARRRSGTTPQKSENGSPDKLAKDSKTSQETSEVVVPRNVPAENIPSGPTMEKNQKQKGKRSGTSAKKQKVAAGNQQTDKAPELAPTPAPTPTPTPTPAPAPAPALAAAASASASNYLTLPTVLPRQEAENSERTNSEGGNDERDMRSRNALMNQAMKFSSQLNFTPRSQNNDGIFSQNGMRNVSDYEQNITPISGNIRLTGGNTNGNGNGNGNMYPFALPSQGLNGGIGMPNFSNQFGLQYHTQESILSGLRINAGHPILPTGNHPFSDSYGAYNQQLRFNAQGGLMPLHSPDNIRAGNLQQR